MKNTESIASGKGIIFHWRLIVTWAFQGSLKDNKPEGQGIEDRQPLNKVKLTGNCLEVSSPPERMLAAWYRAG